MAFPQTTRNSLSQTSFWQTFITKVPKLESSKFPFSSLPAVSLKFWKSIIHLEDQELNSCLGLVLSSFLPCMIGSIPASPSDGTQKLRELASVSFVHKNTTNMCVQGAWPKGMPPQIAPYAQCLAGCISVSFYSQKLILKQGFGQIILYISS